MDKPGIRPRPPSRSSVQDLSEQFDVRIKTFADTITAQAPDDLAAVAPDGDVSDLAAAIGDGSEGTARPDRRCCC